MALQREISRELNNSNEDFDKRLNLANNAFKSSEVQFVHKEAFLILWLLKNSDCRNDTRRYLLDWIRSFQFMELTRNEISDSEMEEIIEYVTSKILKQSEYQTKLASLEIANLLIKNKTFQQFYKTNIQVFCNFVSTVLDIIDSDAALTDFLNIGIFPKALLSEKYFLKHFLNICLPSLLNCTQRLGGESTFNNVCLVVQRCIFFNNHKSFSIFLSQFFEDSKPEKQPVPKALYEFLANVYDKEQSAIYYRLLFQAFVSAYQNDYEVIFKCFTILVHMIGFDLENKLLLHRISKIPIVNNNLTLTQSQEIFYELLQVLTEISIDSTISIGNSNLTTFLENILIEIIKINKPSKLNFSIITKAIDVDPLTIHRLTDQIIIYAMTADNKGQEDAYEHLLKTIFDVYVKLHRVENLVAKIVNKLYMHYINRTAIISAEEKNTYKFRGSIECNSDEQDASADPENIFSSGVMECFSRCIGSLASWQVINVFKTLLYSLNRILENMENNVDHMFCNYVSILSILFGAFLSSVRIAEHTVTATTIEKFVNCLKELQGLLQKLVKFLLENKSKNNDLFNSFLNIAYYWAEVYMMLEFYSTNSILPREKTSKDCTACYDLTYLHDYILKKEWSTLAKIIIDCGDERNINILRKLLIQKLRAIHLFEEVVDEEVVNKAAQNLKNVESDWQDMLNDNFVVNNLLNRSEMPVILLAEKIIENPNILTNSNTKFHIMSSATLLNAINYVSIGKINKLLRKKKRKHDDISSELLSSKMYSIFTGVMSQDIEENGDVIQEASSLLKSHKPLLSSLKLNENAMISIFDGMKKFPIIYSKEIIKQMVFIYFVALHRDLEYDFKQGNYTALKISIENFILGILQMCKFKLVDTLDLKLFHSNIIENYSNWEKIFTLVCENIFKCEESIKDIQTIIDVILEDLLLPAHLSCSIIVINLLNKVKKSRMSKETKSICERYKASIFENISKLVTTHEPQESLQLGYVYSLNHYLSQNEDEWLPQLKKHLQSYMDYAIDLHNCNSVGAVLLFTTVAQNKILLEALGKKVLLRIWNACKENVNTSEKQDEYSRLMLLISEHIPNEDFENIKKDLLALTKLSIDQNDFGKFKAYLHIWESTISCHLNPEKTKILQGAVELLLQKIATLLQSDSFDEDLIQRIINFEKKLIQTVHLHLTDAMIDICLLSMSTIMNNSDQNFHYISISTIGLLSTLLQYRKPLVMDRLNTFLMQYRRILQCLCKNGNSDLKLSERDVQQVSDCAHQFEKLTRSLVVCQKDMARIVMYLISDILNQYETVTLYTNVKIHMDNCIYSLMSICDQHAVAFSMRVLSNASTEIFKIMYDNYKKYYRFTGKV